MVAAVCNTRGGNSEQIFWGRWTRWSLEWICNVWVNRVHIIVVGIQNLNWGVPWWGQHTISLIAFKIIVDDTARLWFFTILRGIGNPIVWTVVFSRPGDWRIVGSLQIFLPLQPVRFSLHLHLPSHQIAVSVLLNLISISFFEV